MACALSLLPARQIGGGQSINGNLLKVAIGLINESRQLRLQPFNEYRKRFGMRPYASFQELTGRSRPFLLRGGLQLRAIPSQMPLSPTAPALPGAGEEEKAAQLAELYGDIDALEFYPGLLLEKPQANAIFGESMVEIGAPFSLKGLLGNPICSPEYWKPSTFGGATGFALVQTASLQKLVCNNVRRCPYVSFHVPDPSPEPAEHSAAQPSTEL